MLKIAAILLGLQFAMSGPAADATGTRSPILMADPVLDQRTVVAPSAIPNAGNGLFARVSIKHGEVIGELGGKLVEEPDLDDPSAYLAGLPDCAFVKFPRYRYIDAKDHGGHASRINFAPRTINGTDTHFQNAVIQRVCHAPYVVFVALKDIEPGTEIWSSYGPHYNYGRFMYAPAVREFFCGRLGIDCRETFEFEH